MKTQSKPEILSPVGDFDRLRAAILYGADAIYLGGEAYGMRSAVANFGFEKLSQAVALAHGSGVRVYLTCNTLPRCAEMAKLPQFLDEALQAGVDALIVTDFGVMRTVKRLHPEMELHVSTQAGVVNHEAATAFYEMGAKRVVLARELSLSEITEIREKTPAELEIECFVHGAMCMSFSGRCLLSNYLCGRDANAGDCAQPCRWKYALVEEKRPGQYMPIGQDESGTYILNSKDMCMLEHIPDLVKAGISSFKIEGRAKGEYYTAVVTNAYRTALDSYLKSPEDYSLPEWLRQEMNKVSYREYCTGFYFDKPHENAAVSFEGGYRRKWEVCATVDGNQDGRLLCTQRNRFFEGDVLEVLSPGKEPFELIATGLRDENGIPVTNTNRAMMHFSLDCAAEIAPGSYLRKRQE